MALEGSGKRTEHAGAKNMGHDKYAHREDLKAAACKIRRRNDTRAVRVATGELGAEAGDDEPELPPLNEGHWFEAMDRAYTVGVMFDQLLAEHRAVLSDPEVRALVEKIAEDLGALYQLCGSRFSDAADAAERKRCG